MAQDKEIAENDMDWEHRILCSDESCIGIIGTDGKCRECGKIYEGELPENFGIPHENTSPIPTDENLTHDNLLENEEEAEQDESENAVEEESDDLDPDWENRILCIDENCIGVIGPDGKCKECGKPYEEDKK